MRGERERERERKRERERERKGEKTVRETGRGHSGKSGGAARG